jgi:hypothetical protein
MKPGIFRRLFNLWPPLLFAGIRIESVDAAWRSARVRLKLRWYNRRQLRRHAIRWQPVRDDRSVLDGPGHGGPRRRRSISSRRAAVT